jgi:hypothetical protein
MSPVIYVQMVGVEHQTKSSDGDGDDWNLYRYLRGLVQELIEGTSQ